VTIHVVRGHFPINEWGFAIFSPSEYHAQAERGRRRLFVNLVAMTYYWVAFVERKLDIRERARQLIRENPEIYRGLSEAERASIPSYITGLFWCQTHVQKTSPFPCASVPTGTDRREVEAIVNSYPDGETNESRDRL